MLTKTFVLAGFLLSATCMAQSVQLDAMTPQLQVQQVDMDALAKRKLEEDNSKLRAENSKLKTENSWLLEQNGKLQSRIDAFTSLGGSEVHAFCPARSLSQNTAGATEDCGVYACAPVSGLCNTRCDSANDCTLGAACTVDGQCEYPRPADSD